jgi:PAS domain S-box-containing protein
VTSPLPFRHLPPVSTASPEAWPEGRPERLLASLDEGWWEHDLATDRIFHSQRLKHLLGFAHDEWPDDPELLRLRIHLDDRGAFETVEAHARRDDAPGQCQVRMLCRDGQWRWFRLRLRGWHDQTGRPAYVIGTLQDIDTEVRAIRELQAMTQRFERAISASAEGLFEAVWGEEQVYLNERARELLGLSITVSSFVYNDLRARIHPDEIDAVRQQVNQAVLALERWQVTYRAQRFDQPGRYTWFRERGTAVREASGQIRVWGMVADVHDEVSATERLESRVARRTAELAAALRLAETQRQVAEAANSAKATFLGQMSHELRTPLNGVIGMNQLAQQAQTATEQRRYVEMAQQSAHAMLHVVDDLLDFARAEAGKLTLSLASFDLPRVLARTLAAFMPQARQRGLGIVFDYEGEVSHFVGDAARLQQMVSNLVSNATKFTESGQIGLTAQVRRQASDAGRADLLIEVTDTGPGMDALTARRVFEPFEQADPTTTRRHGGTGLGLSIVRMLAQLMGGEASVQTAPGAGASFRLSLSLPIAAEPAPMLLPPPGHAWILSPVPPTGPWIGRRLERLNWTWERIESLGAALVRLRSAGTLGALGAVSAVGPGAPAAVLVAEQLIVGPDELTSLAASVAPGCRVTVLNRPGIAGQLVGIGPLPGVESAELPLVPEDLCKILMPRSADAHAKREEAPTEPMPLAAAGRVLVVEDNALNRVIAREMLTNIGVPSDEAADAEEALEHCLRTPPDLVLMDVQMPGMDGLEATRRLRQWQREGRLPRFPILALTANALPADVAASLDAGMDEHLSKPFQLDALRRTVMRHLPPAFSPTRPGSL